MYSAVIKAVCDFLKSVFNYAGTVKEKQSETEVIKDKRDYKKATDIAEKIIAIAEIYKPQMSFVHRMRFKRLCSEFKEYN